MKRSGILIVLSGPSGVGKSTLVKLVRAELGDIEFSVSCTTRPPRTGERDGVDYHFLSDDEFERRFRNGEFLESAQVFSRRYGTLRAEVDARLDAGKTVLLDIDVQGARSIRAVADRDPRLAARLATVMIAPPSLEALEARLRGRSTDSCEQIALRLAGAKRELDAFRLYDFIVFNDDLKRAAAELAAIFRALRQRTALIEGEHLYE